MEPATRIDQMKPALYKAAVEGKPKDYYEALQQIAMEGVGRQVTPNGNTVLHVAALHGHKHFVEEILKNEEDHAAALSMLFAQNKNDETVLHHSAEKGYADIVSVLINATKKYEDLELGVELTEMIRMTDNVKDMALHKAARKGHLDVVKLLVKEDIEFEYPANAAGETPIYLAAESRFHDCLVEILTTCKNPSYGGPLGRNALHAAVLSGYTKPLLEREISLCEKTDDFGWTPLHYAVKLRDDETVRTTLEEKSSAVYIRAGRGDEWTTTFHIAARDGNVEMMKDISHSCPDCWEMINSKGQNVFHEALLSHRKNVTEYIFRSPQIDNLIEEKDEDGNTPLHLLAISNCYSARSIVNRLSRKHLVFNKQQQTPFDMVLEHRGSAFLDSKFQQGGKLVRFDSRIGRRGDFTENPKKRNNAVTKGEEINQMLQSSQTKSIVSSLILTVTFAAALTVPGGYNSNPGSAQGKPILLRNAAFKTFVVTDTIAFAGSMLSIILYSGMAALAKGASSTTKYRIIMKLYQLERGMIFYASAAVIVAFVSGMYATLAPLSDLAYSVLAIVIFFTVAVCMQYIVE